MTAGSALITATGLSKTYPDTTALAELSFTLKPGEVLGLLGPNGAGKTTAMHILLGLLMPSSGSVSVLGLSPFDDRHELSGRVNFSSAYVQLPSNLKVLENLKTYARLYSVKSAHDKIPYLLDLFEMSHLGNRLTGALSSGEKTRLNLCKCLLNDPEILFLDEPTASLDPEMADTVRAVLTRIQKERRMGMVYTSHNMKEVEAICDRILFMNRGRVIAQGTRQELLTQYASVGLEEVFIKIVRGGEA